MIITKTEPATFRAACPPEIAEMKNPIDILSCPPAGCEWRRPCGKVQRSLAATPAASGNRILGQAKSDVQAAIASQRGQAAKRPPLAAAEAQRRPPPSAPIAYLRIGSKRFDFVREIICSIGVDLAECVPDDVEIHDKIIISCLGVPTSRYSEYMPEDSTGQQRLIVTDAQRSADYEPLGDPLVVRASCKVIRSACCDLIRGELRSPMRSR